MMSMAFHPQTDGATERANQSIGQILQVMIEPNQSDWVEKIPLMEFDINSNISSLTGFAPFELNYGFIPTFIRWDYTYGKGQTWHEAIHYSRFE